MANVHTQAQVLTCASKNARPDPARCAIRTISAS